MGATNAVCPSARALMQSIEKASPAMGPLMDTLARMHVGFVRALGELPATDKGYADAALAKQHAEDALARALKAVGDHVMR